MFTISQDRKDELIIQLLIRLITEHEATRSLFVGEYIRHLKEDINELNVALRDARKEAEQSLIAQIRTKYGNDFPDIDALLNSVL